MIVRTTTWLIHESKIQGNGDKVVGAFNGAPVPRGDRLNEITAFKLSDLTKLGFQCARKAVCLHVWKALHMPLPVLLHLLSHGHDHPSTQDTSAIDTLFVKNCRTKLTSRV